MKQIKSTKAALGEIPSDVFLDASSTLAISTKKNRIFSKMKIRSLLFAEAKD